MRVMHAVVEGQEEWDQTLFFRAVRFFGTLSPSARASEMPIAIACSRLFTGPPAPPLPLLSVPASNSFMTLPIFLVAFAPYLRALFLAAFRPPFLAALRVPFFAADLRTLFFAVLRPAFLAVFRPPFFAAFFATMVNVLHTRVWMEQDFLRYSRRGSVVPEEKLCVVPFEHSIIRAVHYCRHICDAAGNVQVRVHKTMRNK